jgi:hypothetical protein
LPGSHRSEPPSHAGAARALEALRTWVGAVREDEWHWLVDRVAIGAGTSRDDAQDAVQHVLTDVIAGHFDGRDVPPGKEPAFIAGVCVRVARRRRERGGGGRLEHLDPQPPAGSRRDARPKEAQESPRRSAAAGVETAPVRSGAPVPLGVEHGGHRIAGRYERRSDPTAAGPGEKGLGASHRQAAGPARRLPQMIRSQLGRRDSFGSSPGSFPGVIPRVRGGTRGGRRCGA